MRLLVSRGFPSNQGAVDVGNVRANLRRRFLRARRWIAEDAYKQFKETEDWRAANNIDTLYRTIELDAYEQSRRLVGPDVLH
jgi:hypothetical protein